MVRILCLKLNLKVYLESSPTNNYYYIKANGLRWNLKKFNLLKYEIYSYIYN